MLYLSGPESSDQNSPRLLEVGSLLPFDKRMTLKLLASWRYRKWLQVAWGPYCRFLDTISDTMQIIVIDTPINRIGLVAIIGWSGTNYMQENGSRYEEDDCWGVEHGWRQLCVGVWLLVMGEERPNSLCLSWLWYYWSPKEYLQRPRLTSICKNREHQINFFGRKYFFAPHISPKLNSNWTANLSPTTLITNLLNIHQQISADLPDDQSSTTPLHHHDVIVPPSTTSMAHPECSMKLEPLLLQIQTAVHIVKTTPAHLLLPP